MSCILERNSTTFSYIVYTMLLGALVRSAHVQVSRTLPFLPDASLVNRCPGGPITMTAGKAQFSLNIFLTLLCAYRS